ncbi:hypothetical protein BC936DRAFT_148922 [Jimgerdemannia flammicorona]|uniref:Rapamycin-insensitive companion of mTOR domain-containing protein n=1 Tax=Jimgerdemannia flammicorona TaxID=994334 RepID=A0A433D200_9FUNG|nr:hypothetical protein BC936DRAFT_148922 [Jimgerdemannia flammicorona]
MALINSSNDITVQQLYDPQAEACQMATMVLDGACNYENSTCLSTCGHLSDVGNPLLLRFLSNSTRFRYLNELDYVEKEMEDWFKVHCPHPNQHTKTSVPPPNNFLGHVKGLVKTDDVEFETPPRERGTCPVPPRFNTEYDFVAMSSDVPSPKRRRPAAQVTSDARPMEEQRIDMLASLAQLVEARLGVRTLDKRWVTVVDSRVCGDGENYICALIDLCWCIFSTIRLFGFIVQITM